MSLGIASDGYYGGVANLIYTTYRMRAKDTTLNRYVYWQSNGSIDSTGAGYTGPGPITDIVVQKVLGKI